MIIYLILFIPVLLSAISYIANKKYSKKILGFIPFAYLLLFLLNIFFYKNNILVENQFFILDYTKSIFSNFNMLENINILYFNLILLISVIVLNYSYFYFKKEIHH